MAEQTIEYVIQPQGKVLQDYSDSRSRVSLIMGPLGSGKTVQSCLKVIDLMCEQEPTKDKIRLSRWLAVRNTYQELFTTTIKDWLSCNEELGRFVNSTKEPPHQDLEFDLPDGTTVKSQIYFVAFDMPAHVKKARGLQLTGVWLNEVKELSKPVIDMLDLRHGRYPSAKEGAPCTWHGMIGDTNAPDEDHWYYQFAEEQTPDDWAFFRQPGGVYRDGKNRDALGQQVWAINQHAENIHNLPQNYYKAGMQGKNEDWIAVNLANEYGYVMEGKAVYPEYSDPIHCPEGGVDFLPDLPIGIGWDFGLTPCIVVVQLTDDGQLRIIDELVSEDMGVKQFARDAVKPFLAKYLGGKGVGLSQGDPAGKNRHETNATASIDILNDVDSEDDPHFKPIGLGFITEPAQSNVIIKRISAVSGYLTKMVFGKPGLVIDKRCKVLRKGFQGGYMYNRINTSQGGFKDSPAKNEFSHPHDGLQYIAMGAVAGKIVEPVEVDESDWQFDSVW